MRHSTLSGAWHLGFSRFKLVEGKEVAGYVAKYLHKSAEARVRASFGYGKTVSHHTPGKAGSVLFDHPIKPEKDTVP